MPAKNTDPPDELNRLLPLTPAVFFILFALANGEKHGYAIMQEANLLSDGKFRMGTGTLYTTIQRLLEMSLIEEGRAGASERRRYYRLTRTGRIVFKAELSRMDKVLKVAIEHRFAHQEGG